jgi:diaminohydroxyphosphoribosylaminopyrimidine deaminase/5-amino-6-(5-phosphoribosylamino)uracil reductase
MPGTSRWVSGIILYKIIDADNSEILKMTVPYKNKQSFSAEDQKYMKLAIKLAEEASGDTSPNPMVGAVIVKDGKIISTGFHKKAGGSHAEIEAINSCRDTRQLEGSKLYVTLEPCSIFGRTPPCTEALIRHRFGEVIIGSVDPNPKINGNGIKLLQEAGIRTSAGLFEDIIAKQNEVFFKSVLSKMPFVALKIASSIDGKTALKNKRSKWITSGAARETVQKIRYRYDCILTGINTVIADDPLLYPRYAGYNRSSDRFCEDYFRVLNENSASDSDIKDNSISPDNPGNSSNAAVVKTLSADKKFFRVILDSGLRISADSNIVKTASLVKTIIFTDAGKSADTYKTGYLVKAGIDILKVKKADFFTDAGENYSYLDLKEVLEILYTRYEITSVLVESGPTLMTEFIKHGLGDKFYFFIAPKIIGGDSPFNMFSGLGISAMEDTVKLDFDKIKKVGGDIFITAYPAGTGPAIVSG